jgi:uncharacterized protein YegP (UPF0339 family)
MANKILEQYTLKTATTEYFLQVFSDDQGLYRWRIMWGEEEVGSCNQGYKSKSSIYSNIERQSTLLNMFSTDLPNDLAA